MGRIKRISNPDAINVIPSRRKIPYNPSKPYRDTDTRGTTTLTTVINDSSNEFSFEILSASTTSLVKAL
jgi:hypothetical protein